jgi:hypothetical protein
MLTLPLQRERRDPMDRCTARLLLHACSYTPALTRLLLHAYFYTPTLTLLLLHAYSYTPTLTQQRERRDPMDRCNDLYLETSLLQGTLSIYVCIYTHYVYITTYISRPLFSKVHFLYLCQKKKNLYLETSLLQCIL